jgi:hypothetical protein
MPIDCSALAKTSRRQDAGWKAPPSAAANQRARNRGVEPCEILRMTASLLLRPHLAHGLHIPRIPAAAQCSPASLATAVRVQAVSQCTHSLRRRRFPILGAPPVRRAVGEMELDTAIAEQRDPHRVPRGWCTAGWRCKGAGTLEQLPQDVVQERRLLAARERRQRLRHRRLWRADAPHRVRVGATDAVCALC